jgi:NTE family protein
MASRESSGVILALGGGGARGVAHVGVLEVLEEQGIPVRGIAGTSMGGLVGALHASGQSAAAIADHVRRFARPREVLRLIDVGLGPGGLSVRGVRLYERLAEQLEGSMDFEHLGIPFAVTAVDLDTGREVILAEGSVPTAVRATISVPGVFEPVRYRDMKLVDGGLLRNVPVEPARRLGPHPVVAVDVLPPFGENEPGQPPRHPPLVARRVPRRINDASHLRLIMIAHITATQLAACPPDLLLRPALPPEITVLAGFHRTEELFEAGRAAARDALPRLSALAGG